MQQRDLKIIILNFRFTFARRFIPFRLISRFLVYRAFWIHILKCKKKKKEETIKNIFFLNTIFTKISVKFLNTRHLFYYFNPLFFSYSIKNFYITRTGQKFHLQFYKKNFLKIARLEGFSSVPQTRDIEKRKRFEADKEGKMVERCNYPRVCGPFARKIAP